MQFKRLLVAVDDDPVATNAAFAGLELANSLKAEVAFVHAVDPSLGLGATDAGLLGEDIRQHDREEAERVMADFCTRAALTNAVKFVPEARPDAAIVETARGWNADLIVIGSHGRHGIERVLLGSVAQAVVANASCSVLVVRKGTDDVA